MSLDLAATGSSRLSTLTALFSGSPNIAARALLGLGFGVGVGVGVVEIS